MRLINELDEIRIAENSEMQTLALPNYFTSVMNMKDFLEDTIGVEFCGIISEFARNSSNNH